MNVLHVFDSNSKGEGTYQKKLDVKTFLTTYTYNAQIDPMQKS